ncbi:PF09234 domain protein [Leptospira weilii str. Ecochallenge]|uniref:PF09234 domain protein n=1 Tax=Leptospira weilii str. Ecochallenge TaxID=1049986 RepID=N1TZJ8_9LEPT|nr:PF09234 domain protein [Leptospira weilii str. Ecochallenge]
MNAIGLNFDPVGERKLGQSKLGGPPDLPASLSYPKDENGNDIPFLCQLNLGEFDNEIASEGILYFFVNWMIQPSTALFFFQKIQNL